MKTLQSCEFNMDTSCVELVYTGGTVIVIDTAAVENEYAKENWLDNTDVTTKIQEATR